MIKSRCTPILIRSAIFAALLLYIAASTRAASTVETSSKTNGIRSSLLSNLFRRQVRQQGEDAQASTENSTEADTEDPQNQTELDAQKFVDSLPGAVSPIL